MVISAVGGQRRRAGPGPDASGIAMLPARRAGTDDATGRQPVDQSRSFHSFGSKAPTGVTGLRVLSVVDPSGNLGIPSHFQFLLPLLSTPNLCSDPRG
jgi:hypothetical protein